jgi:hypothetical protein
LVLLTCATNAWPQQKKINLFKVVTNKDEIVIGLTELKATGGADAGAVALQFAPTAKGVAGTLA